MAGRQKSTAVFQILFLFTLIYYGAYMDKTKLMNSLSGPDEKLLFSKALDRALLCEKNGFPSFSTFLDPLKCEKFAAIIEKEGICRVSAYGGAMDCERKMLAFFNEYDTVDESDFPINALEIIHNSSKLTHRDFLGSVLGCGVNRERIGDIFIFQGKAIVFLEREISSFVCGALEKIGNTPVERSIIKDDFLLAPFNEGQTKNITIASMRLDAAISAIWNISRGKAAKLIEAEKAFVNWICVKSSSKLVEEGDTITLRGLGRAIIEAVNGRTKKDNIAITVKVFGDGKK